MVVSVSGSTSIKASGVVTGENRTIYAQGKGEAGRLKVVGKLELRFGPLGNWEIANVDHVVFEGDSGQSERVEIYTF